MLKQNRPAPTVTADLRSRADAEQEARRQDRNVAAQAAKAVGASPRAVEQAARVAPPGWLLTSEVAELLGVSIATIGNWRHRGRFGAEGQGWVVIGRTAWYCPAAVERLEATYMPPELDQLLSDVLAA